MQELIKKLRSGCVITTVGDVMIDQWLYGSSWRSSQEYGKRVDICDIDREVMSCGGAANTARHVASLGATSNLIGVVGDDLWDRHFDSLGQQKCIVHFTPIVDFRRPTTIKTRVINEILDCDDVCVRFDRESRKSLSNAKQGILMGEVDSLKSETDVFIISDYGKGVITPWIVEQLVATEKPVIVDLKYHAEGKYDGVALLKPNDVDISLGMMLELSEVAPVMTTLGQDGIELWDKGVKKRWVDGWKVPVKDAVGAGDAVVAGIALAIASGLSLFEAMEIGNLAGAASVMEEGTLHGVTREKMEAVLSI